MCINENKNSKCHIGYCSPHLKSVFSTFTGFLPYTCTTKFHLNIFCLPVNVYIHVHTCIWWCSQIVDKVFHLWKNGQTTRVQYNVVGEYRLHHAELWNVLPANLHSIIITVVINFVSKHLCLKTFFCSS